jgi:hypothetical protein
LAIKDGEVEFVRDNSSRNVFIMIYLINTITSWDEPPRARHQVAQAVAKNHKVYFIARNEFGVPKILEADIMRLIEPACRSSYQIG